MTVTAAACDNFLIMMLIIINYKKDAAFPLEAPVLPAVLGFNHEVSSADPFIQISGSAQSGTLHS